MNTVILAAAAADAPANSTESTIFMLVLWALVIFAFYFFLMRPQKKRQKEEMQMRENLQIGDKVITTGGISGKVVALKEKEIIIETGSDRTKLTVMRWAIQINQTKHDDQSKNA